METSLFQYQLPKDRIAQKPVTPRDHARLMVMDRASGAIEHHRFYELPELLRPSDLLVFNDTKVFKARLFGVVILNAVKDPVRIELFLLRPLDRGWEALAQPARKLAIGSRIDFNDALCTVLKKLPDGRIVVDFEMEPDAVIELTDRIGHVPVPPYIKKEPTDLNEYQTIFAKHVGSVAAPTASFHFTEDIFSCLDEKGIERVFLTLHVGLGTFLPMKSDQLEEHVMHEEWVAIPSKTADAINRAKQENRRVIAVGTTVTRALEGIAANSVCHSEAEGRSQAEPDPALPGISVNTGSHPTGGQPKAGFAPLRMTEGMVNLFITPGFDFKIIDGLITNFHLPKSTLLVLVSAFAGRERVLAAYEKAKAFGYRFFSFGDAMFIQ